MTAVVLVTGGSGFIGTWVLRELLGRGARAIALDTQQATDRWRRVIGEQAKEIVWSDAALIDRDAVQRLMEQYGVTHMIHLAALLTPACQQDPFLGCQVNVLGSTAVFDAARRAGSVKAISYASSYAVYGADAGPGAEVKNQPPMFYGAFKKAVDLIAEQYSRHFGLASLALRPHVVYGPERDQGLTAGPSLACRAAANGEEYTIGYSGPAGYDYVEDVAYAFVRGALECPPGATIVDMPGQQATHDDFVHLIEQVEPAATGHISISGPPIPANISPSPRNIANLFRDWKATPLIEGVRKTIEFYRQGAH